MIKSALTFVFCFLPFFAYAQFAPVSKACVRTISGVTCAAPLGGIGVDTIGSVLCGRGECAIDSIGQVQCSKLPGGGAMSDAIGIVRCIGGCEPAKASYCINAQ